MTDWVRLWHDMPTDPKWRVIARKSGQPLPCVLAVFTMMLTNASANASERGSLLAWDNEDIAAALDMEVDAVSCIYDAMQGKVLDGQRLTGWDRRQPKREDSSAERVARHRDAKKRSVTQGNSPDTETEEEKKETPPTPPAGGRRGKHLLPPDWELPTVAELPPKARACAEKWSISSYETHGEAFVSYWRGEGKMKTDWRGTWANRVVALHAQVVRDEKFGNAPPMNGQGSEPLAPEAWNAFCEKTAANFRAMGRERDALEWERKRKPVEEQRTRATGPPRTPAQILQKVAH